MRVCKDNLLIRCWWFFIISHRVLFTALIITSDFTCLCTEIHINKSFNIVMFNICPTKTLYFIYENEMPDISNRVTNQRLTRARKIFIHLTKFLTSPAKVYNNQQFIVHPVINYWSCPQSGQEFSSCGCWGHKGSPMLFIYKIKHKIANKNSNNSYTEDQGRNAIKLPKTAYNSFSKVWKQLIWFMESIFIP